MANEQHSLATYVSDMLAVERHVRIPFETQQKDADISKYADSSGIVTRLVALSQQHVEALEGTLQRLGGHEASPVKSAVSEIEGVIAGAIDKIRKTKVSKALRDDYTALSLCSVSYSELLATANALGDSDVAQLAQRHLEDYAQAIMEIGQTVPAIVARELSDIGLNVDTSTSDTSRQMISQSWQRTARSYHEGDTASGTTSGSTSGTTGSAYDGSNARESELIQ